MDLVKIFKALGHEFRFNVVQMLLAGDIRSCCDEIHSYEQGCCVTDLTAKFEMPQSTISHHLSILVESGLIHLEKRGLWSVYLINQNTVRALHELLGDWASRFAE